MASALLRQSANRTNFVVSRSPAARSSSLISRRGLAAASDHHGPAKVDCWKEPMNPGNWKEEHFVIASLSGWGLLIFGGYKIFSGGKKEEKGGEAPK